MHNNENGDRKMDSIKKFTKKPVKALLLVLALLLTGVVTLAAYVFVVSPMAIIRPKLEHAHMRMQLVVDGEAIDFADQKYQSTYQKGSCSADIPDSPIHFHDNKNQFVHLHWKGMTGGLLLKNYGWDMIGGPNKLLGYRLDALPVVESVKTHESMLPKLKEEDTFWVYTGDENDYKERSFDDFVRQDLETFFGTKSSINTDEVSIIDTLFPRALAHDGSHGYGELNEENTEEELQRMNNLLGNVVVFVQEDKPSDQQITRQFNSLEPLTDSTCGG